jgi:hypothetical protein
LANPPIKTQQELPKKKKQKIMTFLKHWVLKYAMKILIFIRATTFGLTTMVYGFSVKGILRTIKSNYKN